MFLKVRCGCLLEKPAAQAALCPAGHRFGPAKSSTMSGASPPVDALEPEGWAHNGAGKIVRGKPRSKAVDAYFKHSRALQAEDVLRMQVVEGSACVGFAAESYDVEKHVETCKGTAWVFLLTGMTLIRSGISQDGEDHIHPDHLTEHIPKTPLQPGPSH